MANPFLNSDNRDVETAIMLEQAYQHDIGKAVAFTDGNRIFINTDDNLFNLLPAYDHNMLKWLLWHERYHKELRHHNRFFKYLRELNEEDTMDEFHVTKEEVNIIMDILVHDSLCKLFPELVETAINNLAQMRNRNSLGYTFKSFVLEDMLQEYADFKHKDKKEDRGAGEGEEGEEDKEEDSKDGKGKGEDIKSKDKDKKSSKEGEGEKEDKKKEHGEGGHDKDKSHGRKEDGDPEIKDTSAPEPEPKSEHNKTDWSKLDEIDSKEFIEKDEGDHYVDQINELKKKKFRLGKLTQTLNGLATTTRQRSYAMPSTIHVGKGVLLKGRTPGKTNLYLCFDASGSMGSEMETFKEIISKSIPQAMSVPTAWFSGYCARGSISHARDKEGRNSDYYKAQFKDFMDIFANSGYDDDGDRTIELCWKAEQQGYSPIGVTDGGGCISWSKDMIKQLRRTILVGQSGHWLEAVQKINPKIQIIVV